MNVKAYYSHARSLGAFAAADCLAMARTAAALDHAAAVRRAVYAGASAVSYEILPDESAPLRFSRSIKVY